MKDILMTLAIPAVALILLSKLGAMPRIPRPLRLLLGWVAWVGNVTLAVYCVMVAGWSIYGLVARQTQAQPFYVVLQIVVAVFMGYLAFSFWRSARRSM